MNSFILYQTKELPHIEESLRRHISNLHPLVRPTALHVLDAGGKRLRPLLTILTARALGYAGDGVYSLASSLELLHCATLLHDDILDSASIRRGRPSAHTVYGGSHTILAGDALLALANSLVAACGQPELTQCLSKAILSTVTGEIQEIAHVRDVDLTLEGYLDIITGKTACLIQSACQAGALLARAPKALEEAAAQYGMNLGVAFQLVDDALDYTSPQDVSGKPKGADIREGKLTLPLIFYIESLPLADKARFTKAFKDNALTEEEIASAVSGVALGGHAQRAREMAASYLEKARECLTNFPAAQETELLFAALAGMAGRDK